MSAWSQGASDLSRHSGLNEELELWHFEASGSRVSSWLMLPVVFCFETEALSMNLFYSDGGAGGLALPPTQPWQQSPFNSLAIILPSN